MNRRQIQETYNALVLELIVGRSIEEVASDPRVEALAEQLWPRKDISEKAIAAHRREKVRYVVELQETPDGRKAFTVVAEPRLPGLESTVVLPAPAARVLPEVTQISPEIADDIDGPAAPVVVPEVPAPSAQGPEATRTTLVYIETETATWQAMKGSLERLKSHLLGRIRREPYLDGDIRIRMMDAVSAGVLEQIARERKKA